MNNRIILPGLTTTSKSDWREKTKEIKKFNLREIALFPTYLKIKDRKELYDLLKKTDLERIPHVHLRDDMEGWELDFFVNQYKTEVFNIHPDSAGQRFLKNNKYASRIYIETMFQIDDDFLKSVNMGTGICLDISHWEDQGTIQGHYGYDRLPSLIKKHKVGCCHISAVNDKGEEYQDYDTGYKGIAYSHHTLGKLSELDYVKKYVKYLPKYISIELENSFAEQLKVKEYLENIINSN